MRKSLKTINARALKAIKRDEDLIILTIASSILAAFGIVLQNDFIIIGAMLVTPFFDPVISFSTLIVSQKYKHSLNALRTLGFITIVSLFAAVFALGLLYQMRSLDVDYIWIGTGIEYFIVAIVLGSIGTMLWVWPKVPNISAGISIAISLLPHLVNVARSAFISDRELFGTSLSAFLLNLSGVIIGSVLTLYFRQRFK